MEIEEQELLYSRAAPLRAWRLFRVRTCDERLVLSSPMYHDPEPASWPQAGCEATCHDDHSAPAPRCRCGIYAAVEGTLDSLPGYLLDTAHDRDPWLYAEIACSGRVFVDMRGVRAQRAEIVRLVVPEAEWSDEQEREALGRLLGERYRVPVGGLEDVPAWVTENRRDQGPPPDEVGLRLDLDKLDLWG